jgi:hypothetical protein
LTAADLADWWPLAAAGVLVLLAGGVAYGARLVHLLGLLAGRAPRTCPRCGEAGLELVYADARSGTSREVAGHAYLRCRSCDGRFRRDLRRSWRHLETVSEETWQRIQDDGPKQR